jgi:hypothetical protein
MSHQVPPCHIAWGTPIVLILALAATAACGPSEPLRVSAVQLGRSLNTDNSVGNHTTQFKPGDTIYVSILTPEAGYGTLGVRWTYFGRVVSEPTQEVSYRGAAATEFHLNNSSGFPPGDYKVEVFLNGQPVETRDFRVEK